MAEEELQRVAWLRPIGEHRPAFIPDPQRHGWPLAVDGTALANVDVRRMDNLMLADYIASCGPVYDGMPSAAREALIRLLRANSVKAGE